MYSQGRQEGGGGGRPGGQIALGLHLSRAPTREQEPKEPEAVQYGCLNKQHITWCQELFSNHFVSYPSVHIQLKKIFEITKRWINYELQNLRWKFNRKLATLETNI